MLWDVSIAVVLCLVTIGMAYLGVHVTLHPTDEPGLKRRYKLGFCGCAGVAVALIAIQTIRSSRTQSGMQSQLTDLQTKLAHVHIRMDITSIAVEDATKVGKPSTMARVFAANRRAEFNVTYRNVGEANSERTGAAGDVLVVDSKPDLTAAFDALDRKFEPRWRGDTLVPQEPRFFTAESRVLSADDVKRIERGATGVFVVAIVKFSDSTGNYQQELCDWLQPPGTASVWHGCGQHESEVRLRNAK